MRRACDEDEWASGLDPSHTIEVHEVRDPVIGELLGPDGRLLREVRRPFGFTTRKDRS